MLTASQLLALMIGSSNLKYDLVVAHKKNVIVSLCVCHCHSVCTVVLFDTV